MFFVADAGAFELLEVVSCVTRIFLRLGQTYSDHGLKNSKKLRIIKSFAMVSEPNAGSPINSCVNCKQPLKNTFTVAHLY
jgi:hypothetical protein